MERYVVFVKAFIACQRAFEEVFHINTHTHTLEEVGRIQIFKWLNKVVE